MYPNIEIKSGFMIIDADEVIRLAHVSRIKLAGNVVLVNVLGCSSPIKLASKDGRKLYLEIFKGMVE